MTLRNRVFAGLVLIYLAGLAFFMYRAMSDIDPRYRESAEDALVETAQLLATLLEQDLRTAPAGAAAASAPPSAPTSAPSATTSAGGALSVGAAPALDASRLAPLFAALQARRFSAQIYDVHKTQVELRARVTDARGRVLFDSTGRSTGADFSAWRDVALALRGEYGARTSPDRADDPSTMVMYVSVPVRAADGTIIGVVTAGKPTRSFGRFVDAARRKTLVTGLVAGGAVLLLGVLVSLWLVRPFGVLGDYVRHVREHRRLDVARALRRAAFALRSAFSELRHALAGRSYAADYVQTLTHEVKSPLSAIRGAAELLHEPLPAAERERFLANIERETRRIQDIVDRMMELTALESRRGLDRTEPVALRPLLAERVASAQAVGLPRGVRVRLAWPDGAGAPQTLTVQGDAFLLHRAVGNLLDNALDFSLEGGEVVVTVTAGPRQVAIEVRDAGPGVPAYALGQVFERFYSLPRPGTARRSTGLGLAFVREIAHLHKGEASLGNRAEGGAVARLVLPLSRG
jgi:two-component system sensor histidine kinase CreC